MVISLFPPIWLLGVKPQSFSSAAQLFMHSINLFYFCWVQWLEWFKEDNVILQGEEDTKHVIDAETEGKTCSYQRQNKEHSGSQYEHRSHFNLKKLRGHLIMRAQV